MTMLQHGSVPSTGGGYQIERSLRFNSADSAYLNRTPGSAGNRKTFTWSFWMKRTAIDGSGTYPAIYSAGTSGNARMVIDMNYTASGDLSIGFNNTGSSWAFLSTSALFRDFSAWYHIVVACDLSQATDSNRVKIYVNNVQQTLTGTYPPNSDSPVNNTVAQNIGRYAPDTNEYLNAYLTEFYFVDGSQLTPSSFGETDTDTGVWKPKAYSGTYGTNGFYLKFADNSGTTSTTLGKDSSGNGNNWTPNNFSVTAGAGNDSLVDTPTPYGTDTGAGGEVRGNYATMNPLRISANLTLSNGNLTIVAGNTSGKFVSSTIGVSTGKWYWEGTVTGSGEVLIGVENGSASLGQYLGANANGWGYDSVNGYVYNNGGTAYGNTFTTNDVIGVAIDVDAGKLWFSKNGTWQNSGSPTSGTNAAATNLSGTIFPGFSPDASGTGFNVNFGQRPFAYTAPSGFKALCTTNLPTPTIGATSSTRADDYFNVITYTGTTSSPRTLTGVGFQPDFVWVKNRSDVYGHYVWDAVRGTDKNLRTDGTFNETDVSAAQNGIISTSASDGFIVKNGGTGGLNVGSSGTNSYVAWNWKANGAGSSNTQGTITSTVSANTTSGFSIVTYTGNGSSGATVGHGLGVAPSMVIVKMRSATQDWIVYHSSLGNTKALFLQSTDAAATNSLYWNDTSPTSSLVTLGSGNGTNASGSTYVAYCFAPVAGYSAFGTYNGNGSSDGPFIYTGFRPAFMLVKQSSASGEDWWIYDSKRDTYNIVDNILAPNSSGAEISGGTYPVDFVSNGWKIRGLNALLNTNGATYIYAAFAEHPFKYALAR